MRIKEEIQKRNSIFDIDRKNMDDTYQTELDVITKIFLYITKIKRVEHPNVKVHDVKETIPIKVVDKNEAYVFENYEEFKNYFLMYLDKIDDDLIDMAIYTRGNKGQVVALKKLCEYIIVKKKTNDFYNSITEEQIDEIHSKGKMTPFEIVKIWKLFNLCIDGSRLRESVDRCYFFDNHCHECLKEYASHKLEHESYNMNYLNSVSKGNNKMLELNNK